VLSINALNKKLVAGINHFSTGGSFMRKLSQVLLFFVVIGSLQYEQRSVRRGNDTEAVERNAGAKGRPVVAMDEIQGRIHLGRVTSLR
jgi:hypothetical protein